MDAKFRGRSLNGSKDWVYGSLVVYGRPHVTPDIYEPETSQFIAVDRDTVGQFTGVKDCKGNDIYQGDWVKYKIGPNWITARVHWSESAAQWVKGNNQSLTSYLTRTEVVDV